MRWVPGERVKRLPIWLSSFWAAFLPSIQISMRFTPSGEFPLARTSNGDDPLEELGMQILAERLAEPGGGQLTSPLLAISTTMLSPQELDKTRSLRPSRLRSRSTTWVALSARTWEPKVPLPLPRT